MGCIFCQIAKGEIKSEILYEGKNVIAFKDINPQAPTHILVIPKQHLTSLEEIKQPELLTEIFDAIPRVAKKFNLSQGYRIVMNIGRDAGQAIDHLHFHILGGRIFSWPPG